MGKSLTLSSSMVVVKIMIIALLSSTASIRCCSAATTTGFGFWGGNKKKTIDVTVDHATVFPVHGNVYPLGYFSVSINIGNPPKTFELDIDTGSDLTWVQCHLPCTGCTQPVERQYKPNNNVVPCSDILCKNAHPTGNVYCPEPDDQCDYEVEYADGGSSLGVLLADSFPFHSADISSLLRPRLAFGCGYKQSNANPTSPSTAGVLGLGSGKASIISQLRTNGLMQNVIGHCFSGAGGGFLFLGNSLVPSYGVTWTPMLRDAPTKHYSAGPAELVFSGMYTGLKGLELIFDSGSSYTYFNYALYETTLHLININLNGKLRDAPEETALPVCWKGSQPFNSLEDIKGLFKTMALSFSRSRFRWRSNIQLEIPPENYLILTRNGNVCLGILNGAEVGLEDLNLIGDISMLDKLVIYDNEMQRIGWIPTNCSDFRKSSDNDMLNL